MSIIPLKLTDYNKTCSLDTSIFYENDANVKNWPLLVYTEELKKKDTRAVFSG